MKILVSNDDGYLAPGIGALVKALQTIAEVVVVAPETNRSGASNSLSFDHPLRVKRAANGFYFVNGTPSDCVHIALTGFLDFQPDLVVSGINDGQNMGDDTLYSGTVAAATEGFLFGIPSIAFSQLASGWTHLDAAAKVARSIVQHCRESLESPYLLNVNIPNLPVEKMGPVVATSLGRRHHAQGLVRAKDPRGREVIWIGPAGDTLNGGPGTDFHATAHGSVSLTPLQIDLTHWSQLRSLARQMNTHGPHFLNSD